MSDLSHAPETCEEHLGNALQVVRTIQAEGRSMTLEEFAAIYQRITRALAELVRLNV